LAPRPKSDEDGEAAEAFARVPEMGEDDDQATPAGIRHINGDPPCWTKVVFATLVGLIAYAQAYWLTWMLP
jgi:hypothetical protein